MSKIKVGALYKSLYPSANLNGDGIGSLFAVSKTIFVTEVIPSPDERFINDRLKNPKIKYTVKFLDGDQIRSWQLTELAWFKLFEECQL